MYKLGLWSFIICVVLLGLLWIVLKPVMDEFTGPFLESYAESLGISSQELAFFAILPFLILLGLSIKLIVSLLHRGSNKEEDKDDELF